MAVVLYAISLLLTYSLQLFPAVQIIEELVDNSYSRTNPEYEAIRKLKNDQLITTDKLEIFIRISISAAIYVIAYVVPHFSHFLNLIGSLFGSMIQVSAENKESFCSQCWRTFSTFGTRKIVNHSCCTQ